MTWQFFLVWFLALATITALLQRRLGQTIPQYNRLVNVFFFLIVHYPLALIVASIIGFNLHIGWFNLVTLAATGILFPLTDILAFRASKDVDAGLFGIINNFSPVITIALAALLLSEKLSQQQLAGALIIIFSVLLVSTVTYNGSSKSTRFGIILAFFSVISLAVCTVYESWMLKRIGLGSVLVYSLGFQTFWMVVLAWPQRKYIKKIINRKYGPTVFALSLSKSLKGLAFMTTLYLTKSAAIFSAFISFLPITIILAGYIFLKEKSNLKIKILGGLIGAVGLAVLSLG